MAETYEPTPQQVEALANLLPLGYDYPRDPYPDVMAAAAGIFASDEVQAFIRSLQSKPAAGVAPITGEELADQIRAGQKNLKGSLEMMDDGNYRDLPDSDIRQDLLTGIRALSALAAVLRVHDPIKDTIHHDGPVCSHRHCKDDAMDQTIAPCPTSQAAGTGWNSWTGADGV
ncbi:hypothetical protein LG293_15805 (plasmid) [Citricoccus nitrophenolicus]